MVQASQEMRTETIGLLGRPIIVDTDFTTVGDVTTIHNMTDANAVDAVWLECFNNGTTAQLLSLIVSPNDDSVVGDVDNATTKINIPPQSSVWVMQGQRVRRDAGNSYTIAAYTTDTVGNLRVVGWFNRTAQGAVTS